MSGYTMTQPELYYELPAPVTRTNYVTATQACMSALIATSIPMCMIPAGYFSAIGKSIHFEANGTVTGTTSPTFIMAAGLDVVPNTIGGTGGVTLFTTPATTTAPTTTAWPWTMEFDITAQAVGGGTIATIGAGGTTLQLNGEIDVQGAATNTWATGRMTNMMDANLTSVNNEVNLFLELFATWTGTVTTSDITVVQQFKVYLEN
jgi:hypothetical protein